MRKLTFALFALLLLAVGCNSASTTVKPIKVETPARPDGVTDMINFAAPKIDVVRVGFIGLGARGVGAVWRYTQLEGVEIKALCDLKPELVKRSQGYLHNANLPEADEYTTDTLAWQEMCQRDDIDLVYICTDWVNHYPMMKYAMEHGKHVACEVPAALTLEEIWDLIETSERTRRHCMQLENCVYDFFELTTLNMAQQGLFGEIMHVEGAYIHTLSMGTSNSERRHWRLDYNWNNRGDVYPTHGLGPVAQLLNIHRGDKMEYLVSLDTRATTSINDIKESKGIDAEDFQNGDHTNTLIRTHKGKSILIEHNVATPRPYDRMYQLSGTKGFANKYPSEGYSLMPSQLTEDVMGDHTNISGHSFVPEDVKEALMAKYKHPIHQEIEETAKKVGGHGGMDYVMDYRLVYCLRNGLPLDMDVYDLAEWCCLVPLSKLSLENNSAAVEIPDFTRGGWDKVDGYRHAMAN